MFWHLNDKQISVLIGVIVAIIIYFIFIRNVIYHGVNSNKIRNKVYNLNGRCYKLDPIIHICPIRVSMMQTNLSDV